MSELPDLDPVLKTGASPRNVENANKAIARIREQGWEPRAPYPGSDVLWLVHCLLCGNTVMRFYSHLRRGIPVKRHDGCIPKRDHAAALAALLKSRTSPR